MAKINTVVLMSGAEYFDDRHAINSYMDDDIPVHLERAIQEHADIKAAFEQASIEVIQVPAPSSSQDGVYTANWALVRGNKAVMANLPNKRQPEEAYAEKVLRDLGKDIVKLPNEFHFSGQGDALPCGRYLFVGSQYRTSPEVHPLLARELGYEVIGLQTIPELDSEGQAVINPVTGWPDSFFYDLDLAIAIIKAPSERRCGHDACILGDSAFSQREADRDVHSEYDEGSIAAEKRASAKKSYSAVSSAGGQVDRCTCSGTIAWCPEAFMPDSQRRIRELADIEKIEVSLEEAMEASACNLVSTGETVVMGNRAPKLKKALEDRGLRVITPDVSELMKGGGFIRCTSLTLSN